MPTVAEAAVKLSVSQTRVRTLIKQNVLTATKVGRGFIIDQASLDIYENTRNNALNNRVLPFKHNGTICTIADNPFAVSELLDFGITRFWDEHTKNVLDTMPLVTEKHAWVPLLLNSTFMPLAEPHIADYSNKRLLLQPTMEYAVPKPIVKKDKVKPAVTAKKFKIRVASKIRKVWLEWLQLANEVYNHTAQFLINERNKNPRYIPNKLTLSSKIIEQFKQKIDAICAPAEISKYAVFDAVAAFNMGKEIKPRTMDDYSMAISIRSRGISHGYVYAQNTKRYLLQKYGPKESPSQENETEDQAKAQIKKWNKAKREFKAKFEKEFENMRMKLKNLPKVLPKVYCRLIYKTRLDKWYLDIPTELSTKDNVREGVVAIDPGVRTFLTCYSSSGVFNIGKDVNNELDSLHKAADSINIKISATKNKKKRQSLARALCRINRKIKNKIDNFHWHAIKILSRFDTVILPKFGVKQLSKKLHNKTNRDMFALAHFNFRMRLAQKTSQYGNKLIMCNEAYTSQTCGKCGTPNLDLNGDKRFICASCKFELGRDRNGARNILARALSFGDALLCS